MVDVLLASQLSKLQNPSRPVQMSMTISSIKAILSMLGTFVYEACIMFDIVPHGAEIHPAFLATCQTHSVEQKENYHSAHTK